MTRAIQDFYSDEVSHCYGCGALNEQGLQIKTYWIDDESVTRYTPRAYHTAVPGYVYGGLIASLMDCHGTGTASIALYRAEGREYDSDPPIRCLTASLNVEYVRPTPLGVELVIRGRIKEINGHRVTVECSLLANDVECARGEVVAVQVPNSYLEKLIARSE